MQHYLRRDDEIRNKSYINHIKMINNVRILLLNPKGLDPWNEYKTSIFIESVEKQ